VPNEELYKKKGRKWDDEEEKGWEKRWSNVPPESIASQSDSGKRVTAICKQKVGCRQEGGLDEENKYMRPVEENGKRGLVPRKLMGEKGGETEKK